MSASSASSTSVSDDEGLDSNTGEPTSTNEEDPAAKYKYPGEQWAPKRVEQDHTDFLWMMTEEPHRSRRKAILAAHGPEVRARLYSMDLSRASATSDGRSERAANSTARVPALARRVVVDGRGRGRGATGTCWLTGG